MAKHAQQRIHGIAYWAALPIMNVKIFMGRALEETKLIYVAGTRSFFKEQCNKTFLQLRQKTGVFCGKDH